MHRHAVAVVCLLLSGSAVAQTAPTPQSDALAISLASGAMKALTGGAVITDVSINSSVIAFVGPDTTSGTATLRAAIGASRIDLSLNGSTLSEVRSSANGIPSGAWARNKNKSKSLVQHNNWTDAVWFFPALSSLTQTGNPLYVFKYIGQEPRGGVMTQHIQVFQTLTPAVQQLSAVDFYLDATSLLPLDLTFNTHADQDMNINIPVEIRYANYQPVGGVLVPFHIQRLQGGGLALDVSVSSVAFNAGLQPSTFMLP